jgi:2OG-Fe(II) oxygenase superfamily
VSSPLLSQPKHQQYPFPFFSVDCAFSQERCAELEKLFTLDGAWEHQDGVFYRCSLLDVTELIGAEFQAEVLARMRVITGLPLVDRMLVTAQRMLPGQVIGVHSDRPLLGFETVRLIVQFNKHWQTKHGGVLELFLAPEAKVVSSVNPEYNSALGFVLHPDSYHAVTEATELRQTVVFNFWHAANTPELAAHVKDLFTDLDFSEFPAALNSIASAAEASLPEDVTFRAGTAAIALHRWGYDPATIVFGYQFSAGLSTRDAFDRETDAAVLLADWVAYLYRECFDLGRWEFLQSELEDSEMFLRLKPTWQLCLPT